MSFYKANHGELKNFNLSPELTVLKFLKNFLSMAYWQVTAWSNISHEDKVHFLESEMCFAIYEWKWKWIFTGKFAL